jgi:hypothetical protein
LDRGQPANTSHNDGTHRLYKAHATGAAQLPAWVLTKTETLTIRAPRGSRAARRPGTGTERAVTALLTGQHLTGLPCR